MDNNYSWPFSLQSDGKIKYQGYDPSDVSVGTSYSFTAQVNVQYGSDSATVTINVVAAEPVNHAPVFGQSAYSWSVQTTAVSGAVVGTITATDADGDGVTLALASSSPFVFDAVTGELTVGDASLLVDGATHSYTVTATDGDLTTTATITSL
ncbi:MAG: hypothetical protein R3C01_06530 [Planctomycetaceae bacterium]